jgi:hypothetical protein
VGGSTRAPAIVERATADPRYRADRRRRGPRKIGSHLSLFDCGNCDVFCPEAGLEKPRFFGSLEAWRLTAATVEPGGGEGHTLDVSAYLRMATLADGVLSGDRVNPVNTATASS